MLFPQPSSIKSLTFNWERIAQSDGRFVDFSQYKAIQSLDFLDASLLSNVSLKFPSSIEFIVFHGDDLRMEFNIFKTKFGSGFTAIFEYENIYHVVLTKKRLSIHQSHSSSAYNDIFNHANRKQFNLNDQILFVNYLEDKSDGNTIDVSALIQNILVLAMDSICIYKNKAVHFFSAVIGNSTVPNDGKFSFDDPEGLKTLAILPYKQNYLPDVSCPFFILK